MDETRDDDGFPVPNESNAETLYRDEFGVSYVCTWNREFGWVWLSLGRLE